MYLSTRSFLENILNGIPDPVFVKDSEHRWILVNQAFCALLNRNCDELIGKSDFDFFPEKEAQIFREKDRLVFDSGAENINEEDFTDGQGELRTISTKKTLVKDENGDRFIVGVIRDVTEKRELIEGLKSSNALLENFANMVSHDLLAPLRTLTGFSDLLAASATDKLNETEKRYLKMIEGSAIRMGDLVENLWRFSRVNDQEIEITEIETRDLLKETIADLGNELEKTEYEFSNDTYPKRIKGDRKLLKMLLRNLLSNSIKFRSPDRKLLIHISSEATEDFFKFSIKDNGIGIAAEDLERIFKMFIKLNSSRSFDGSGVGLALCELIVKQHQGSIAAESELGKGTTINFSIKNLPSEPFS